MPKIDDATLKVLDAALEAARPVLDKIDAAQAQHAKGKRGKCFQLLPCFDGKPPADAKADAIPAKEIAKRVEGAEMAVSVADGVDAKGKPKSSIMRLPDPNWGDVLKGEVPAIPCDVKVDEYVGPYGVGYTKVLTASVGGVTYQMAENEGPEDGFAYPWREVVPFLPPGG